MNKTRSRTEKRIIGSRSNANKTMTQTGSATKCPFDDTPTLLSKMAIEKKATLEQIEKFEVDSFTDVRNEILHQVDYSQLSLRSRDLTHESLKYKKKIKSNGLLSNKEFLARESTLSELFKLNHIHTLYNIFIVILIILFLNTAVQNVVTTGRLNLGLGLIMWNFEKPHVWVLIWCCMMFSTIIFYVVFFCWISWRAKITLISVTHRCLGYLGFFSLLAYELLLLCLPVYYICEYELHPGASFTLLMEQVRLMMKTHAFVRSNLHRTLAYKKNDDDDVIHSPCPGFSYFLYFMFAPTLVYRDHYPRAREIRWKVVAFHFAEVGGVVFYIAFILERFLILMFRDFGLHPATPDKIVMVVFGAMMPATLASLCGFYCLLHAWMNAFAEMLQFGDRMFYKDWWNATSHAAYFRTWNVVVRDYLYTYIYKDFCESFKVKYAATMLVFLISAIVHEYILAFTFKFFYPVLFLTFGGFGTFLVFLPKDLAGRGNLILWLFHFIGNGVLTSAYSIEYYARINCVRNEESLLDFFIPRSWDCIIPKSVES